jgi:hypothetical protein
LRQHGTTAPKPVNVTDDWPEVLPVLDAEIRLLERDLLDILGSIIEGTSDT